MFNATPAVTAYPSHSSYTNILPSANLKLEITKDVIARAAFSKTISRPIFSDLGGLDFNATQLLINRHGNPDLKPFTSTNFDFGFEWYFNRTGILSSNFFYKKLANFIIPVTTPNVHLFGVDFLSDTQPQNQSGGEIKGVEITYQQPWSFLPSPLDGFGSQLNFTFSDGELNLKNGTPVAFPGISKFSFNGALYYEKGPISIRAAYTKRSKFLLLPDGTFGQNVWHAPYQQLDLTASVKVRHGVEVFGEVLNLTNQTDLIFSSNKADPAFDMSRPQSRSMVGRRFGFGVRASF
ncbi:MAG: TonB-dependent receptor [Sphingomonadales bacterium]|nr:TonB-dependent receptor [Sphingomonadales bacterium]